MKGIILAGGTGSRLFPLTKTTSKQLLPVYDRQMIFYPLETLKNSGIDDILVITDYNNSLPVQNLLGDGSDYGVKLSYCIQEKPRGLPEAFILGESFIGEDNVTLILGDNIFRDSFSWEVSTFKHGARILAKEVQDPERFGVVTLDKDNKVTSLEEKPVIPKSNLAVPGFYIFDNRVISFAKELTPSKRGELEIIDLQKKYLDVGELEAFSCKGEWMDAGTFDSLLEATLWAKNIREKKDKELAYTNEVVVLIVTRSHNYNHLLDIVKVVLQDEHVKKCVLVDNNSPFKNKIKAEVQRYGERVTLIQKDVTLCDAELMFFGIDYVKEHIKGDYLFILEDDTLPEEDSVKEFLNILDRFPKREIILTGNRVNLPSGSDIFYERPKASHEEKRTFFEGVNLQKIKSFFNLIRGYSPFRKESQFIFMQPVHSFLYAGTFIPMSAIIKGTLPDKNLIKYGDNLEYSWGLNRLGYDIYACYTPKIYDLDLPKSDSLLNVDMFKKSVPGNDVYLKVHNMVLISRRNTKQTRVVLACSILIWFSVLAVYGMFSAGSPFEYLHKIKIILRAIYRGYKS